MAFFNLNLNLKLSHKILLMASIYILSLLIFSSCQPQTPISEAKGDVKVLIPIVGSDSEKLTEVTLKNIQDLKEVSGSYVQFYYTPGAGEKKLTGGAPQARFIRTEKGVHVPADITTQQMFTIYYHIQNLQDLSVEISSDLKTNSPFQVGLNTKVSGNDSTGHNNAFYDGESDALLFVPYSLNSAPIAVNAGIIAHEYFHSIFYRLLYRNYLARQKVLSQQAGAEARNNLLFNETYIRGLNEGFADYWGWVYTTNTDYITASLPEYGEDRKMTLEPDKVGVIETQSDIENRVSEAQSLAFNPTEFLTGYTYKIGTPHARFLKDLTVRLSRDNQTGLAAAKMEMARLLYRYLVNVSIQTATFESVDKLTADHFFQYVAQPEKSGLALNPGQCDFVKQYVRTADELTLCTGSSNE